MRLPPRWRPVRLLLALVAGVALLFPEVAHGLAHHHAAEHRAHGQAPGHDVLPQEPGHGEHPHLSVIASPPVKPLFQVAAVVIRVLALVLDQPGVERRLAPAVTAGLSPGNLFHGPPPPSRAPPQV
jgi:hypothetical protein